jgi:hypothetical protein
LCENAVGRRRAPEDALGAVETKVRAGKNYSQFDDIIVNLTINVYPATGLAGMVVRVVLSAARCLKDAPEWSILLEKTEVVPAGNGGLFGVRMD